jgi:hypothetical protein
VSDTDEIIKSLRDKMHSIISLYEKAKENNQVLQAENESLRKRVEKEGNMVVELEHRNKALNLSKALLASSDDVQDARMKVNNIVREIDKCIALLNR